MKLCHVTYVGPSCPTDITSGPGTRTNVRYHEQEARVYAFETSRTDVALCTTG